MSFARARRRARRAPGVVAVAVLALAGCTSGSPDVAGEVDVEIAVPEPDASSPADDAAADDDPGRELPPAGRCDDGLLAELDALVADQLAAFVDDDWSLALSFASDDFRAEFDTDRLRGVIEDGFPVVAAAEEHRSGACRVQPASPVHAAAAVLDVVVRDGAGGVADLRYLFSLDDDGWGIAGAGPRAGGDGPTVTA